MSWYPKGLMATAGEQARKSITKNENSSDRVMHGEVFAGDSRERASCDCEICVEEKETAMALRMTSSQLKRIRGPATT